MGAQLAAKVHYLTGYFSPKSKASFSEEKRKSWVT
jgi:hypothetical protein